MASAAAPESKKGFEPNNHLLAALPSSDVESLQPHLKVTPLARGSVLSEVDEPLTLRAERALPAGVLRPAIGRRDLLGRRSRR